ncbi:MAG: DNA polymerase I [Candidatus Magasanikbacteria bacterium]|nr:DNA polymerase I [Candidatus Magasanikbacteria bacterium]
METFVIIDGNALLHRAFHAVPPLTARNGQVVNAVYGFTTILLRVQRELKPDYVAVTFDAPGKTFRHERYKAYKATRVKQPQDLYDQFPLVKQVVKGFGLPIFEVAGVEADDVIATIAEEVLHHGTHKKIIIVTGDMDTLQLVGARVEVRTMRKGVSDIVVYDEAAVKERYGLSPDQMVDYKALRGDASDNIKGVSGIGEKTAVELLKKFGTLEKLYAAVEKDRSVVRAAVAEKLLSHKPEAFESKELVILKKDVELDFDLKACAVGAPDTEALIEIFRALDFHSLIKRLSGKEATAPAENARVENKKTKKYAHTPLNTIRVESSDMYKVFLKKIDGAKHVACLVALSGTPREAQLEGAVFAFSAQESYFVHTARLTKEVWKIMEEKQLVVFDLKSMIEALHANNFLFNPRLFTDLMLADYVAHPGSRNHELSSVLLKQTGFNSASADGQSTLFGIDVTMFSARVCLLFQAAERLEEELRDKQVMRVYKEIEAPLVLCLAAMEETGIQLDASHIKKLSKEIFVRIEKISKKIYIIVGREFNIASPQQLKEILFDELEIPVEGIKRGKTGFSTAASELEKMQGQHPIIDLIMDYRELAKLQNTYTDVLPNLVDSRGRLHTTFNQTITSTGRLSSSDPNLQNIPIKTELGREIRKAFIARSGYHLIKADYSQIELRIIAALSKDHEMIKIFEEGADIHRSTAAKINGVAESEVTFAMRSAAKAINFGIIYGLGPHGLAQGAHISFSEARVFIDRYFELFKGVKTYLEEIKLLAHKQGYVATYFGRRRYFPEINSSIAQVRASAERMATNAPMQGTAADIIKLAMIKLHVFLNDSYSRDEAAMVLQVHDELVFEVKEKFVADLVAPIKKIMEEIVDFEVPIVVDVKTGINWGEME